MISTVSQIKQHQLGGTLCPRWQWEPGTKLRTLLPPRHPRRM